MQPGAPRWRLFYAVHSHHLLALFAPWLSLATDLFVAHRALFLGNPKRIGPFRVVSAAAILAAWIGAKMLVVRIVPPNSFFLAIHFAYLDVFVLLPLVGLYLLSNRKLELAKSVRAAALASLLLIPLGIYVTFVEPKRLVVEETTIRVPKERAGREPLRISVLADIQCHTITDHERAAVARAMEFRPHLILLPGDLMQIWPDEALRAVPEFRDLLMPLDAPMGVFFVMGNCDTRDPVLQALEGTRVQFLSDRAVMLEHDGWRVRLGGAEIRLAAPTTRAFVESFEKAPDERELRLLCAHVPDVAHFLADPSRVDLFVCGHTHGGQVQLPLFGPPITLTSVPRAVAAGGYHELGGRRLYVSRGVGCERGFAPQLRFLCPPEVSWLTLTGDP